MKRLWRITYLGFHLINITENETLKVSFFFEFPFEETPYFSIRISDWGSRSSEGGTGERKVINSAGANRRVELQKGTPGTWKVLKCRSCERKFYSSNILLLRRICNTFYMFFLDEKDTNSFGIKIRKKRFFLNESF